MVVPAIDEKEAIISALEEILKNCKLFAKTIDFMKSKWFVMVQLRIPMTWSRNTSLTILMSKLFIQWTFLDTWQQFLLDGVMLSVNGRPLWVPMC